MRIFLRFLYYFLLIWIIYRLIKVFFVRGKSVQDKTEERFKDSSRIVIGGEFVKDPNCNVFFPKEKAIFLNYRGETFYFCSEECKEKYLKIKLQASEKSG